MTGETSSFNLKNTKSKESRTSMTNVVATCNDPCPVKSVNNLPKITFQDIFSTQHLSFLLADQLVKLGCELMK